MSMQLSVPVRNALLDAIETAVGTVPIIEIRTGAMPADCATAASGTALIQQALPSDWMAAASAGSKAKSGSWALTALAGISTANAGYFRIYDSGSPSACHIQGTITATGGGGDMTLDNISIAAGQAVTVTSFTLTAPNA
jgi:hypothetical protein